MILEMLKSLAKLALTPRAATVKPQPQALPLIILGNGPSLRQTLDSEGAALASCPLLAVNFFANSPEFRQLQPEYYVLADPHFFDKPDDPNVAMLINNLNAASWEMTLFVPFGAKCQVQNPHVKLERFPLTAVEGPKWFVRWAFGARRGMPRPRNVLIPSLMVGLWLGFQTIYVVGADHSWPRTISVNERNEVVTIQPHFYKEDSQELERIRVDYLRIPLHQVVESWRVAFSSYWTLDAYARSRGIDILNASAESFIDAFRRSPLPR